MQRDDQRITVAAAARLLLSLGWPAVLPLATGTKWPPPAGYTGREGTWPTDREHRAWWGQPGTNPLRVHDGGGNLALRLPETVVGLDLDLYKPEGVESYRRLVAECGEIPPTWVSSSRDDRSGSGIRLYRVPAGVRWSERRAGPGIEIVRWDHRYVVVPPSIHPSGATYRWFTNRSCTTTIPPEPGELPALPASWGRRLSVPPTPPPASTHRTVTCGSGYAAASLAGACDELASLREGDGRNNMLNTKAYHLGGFIATGQLDEQAVRQELYRAAVANGHTAKHGERKTLATIDSGVRAGMAHPRVGVTR